MAGLLIRTADRGDVDAITGIYAEAVTGGTASFEIEPPDAAEMWSRMAPLFDGGFPYLAAEIDRHVVGYAYAAPYRARPAYRFTVEDSVYIAREWHGRGIGKRLLEELIGAAEARGFRQMVAVITDEAGVSAASIALHRALGFRHVGTLDAVGWKHDRWLATTLMQRALGTGAGSPPIDGG